MVPLFQGGAKMVKCESLSESAINKAKILIIENNAQHVGALKEFLELNGHEVVLALDPTTTLDSVEQHRPDVILIDRAAEHASSTSICRHIKQNRDTSGIPIIVLSDQHTISDKVATLTAGADDFISHSYDDEELIALICARLRSKSEWDDLKQKTQNLEEMLTKIEAVAHIDSLTGLCNRRRFESVLGVEFKRATRYGHPLSCLVLDLDHFKQVNDQHGHLAGDDVLRRTAHVIQKNIREMDVVARWGGEEFIILDPSTDMHNALIVGEKIRSAIEGNVHIDGKAITTSVGVAGIPAVPVDAPQQLIHSADLALYEAKRSGRNCVRSAADVRER